MNNKGLHFLQVDATKSMAPYVDVQEEGLQLDKFAQAMRLVQELSDNGPFNPEWLFNSELPEEIKLFLRNIFQNRISGITSGLDLSSLPDEELARLSPGADETLSGYRSRCQSLIDDFRQRYGNKE